MPELNSKPRQPPLAGEFPKMPTREEVSRKIRADLAARGMSAGEPDYEFVLLALEDMNNGAADLDDELADLAARLTWLARAPTWINQRQLDEFEGFVNAKLAECAAGLAFIQTRWKQHQSERKTSSTSEP